MSASRTIAIALSGGVDSCVSAALLVEAGWSVIGLTAVLTEEESRCCSSEDLSIARQVCRQLGIEHHLVDVRECFETHIIRRFMSDYLSGLTPSPCALCNPLIKFGLLMDRAFELGASFLATGHYARVMTDAEGRPRLLRGVDERKDQSYFLALLKADRLARCVFPVGELRKLRVGQMAAERDLAARKSRESQEICFVPEGGHGTWIEVRSLETRGPGEIVDMSGRVLGTHRGIHHYTVGQRRGLGIATGSPAYVVAIRPDCNAIVVGRREEAMSESMTVRDVSWIRGRAPDPGATLLAQIRYNHKAAPCILDKAQDGTLAVRFATPQFAVAPGQLAVFYEGEEALGGGWIT